MRILCLFLGLLPALAWGQDAPVAARPSGASAATALEEKLPAARHNEKLLAERLAGLRFLATPDQASSPGFPASGIDVSRTPLLQQKDFAAVADMFLGKPVSKESLDHLVSAVRSYLQTTGHSFAKIYLPPQDITGGYVQVVVAEAMTDTAIDVVGAQHFSEDSYRAAIRQQPGKPIDQAQLEEDIAWLNRNPFRQVKSTAAAGAAPGTTRPGLQVSDQTPWSASLGLDNTGSRVSSEYRQSASVQWGNAFGRGDQASYRYSQDPGNHHYRSHNGSYAIDLPWRHALSFSGAWSKIEPALAPPITQAGISWQVGAQYEIPLGQGAARGQESLSFSGDYKYSDSTLAFAAIPVSYSVTHVIQFGATYAAPPAILFGGNTQWNASLYASPGNLSGHNSDADFDHSVIGARARYAYARFTAQHNQPLGGGLRYVLAATAQLATTSLLGSEQLSGAGISAVRGYRESAASGDAGATLRNELHLPVTTVAGGSLDAFGFFDIADLRRRYDGTSTDLQSLGLGVNYQWQRNLSVRAAFGHQLTQADSYPFDRNRGHVSMTFAW